jgi:predicted transcriptional regulator
MSTKKTMTLNLSDAEMEALEVLAETKDLTKTGVLRQALKLYQMVDVRLSRGEKLFIENSQTKEKAELAFL